MSIDQGMDTLRRNALRDGEDGEARVRYHSALRRSLGREACVFLLRELSLWDGASELEQDAAIAFIEQDYHECYRFVGVKVYEDRWAKHRIATFAHRGSGVEFQLIPGASWDLEGVRRVIPPFFAMREPLLGKHFARLEEALDDVLVDRFEAFSRRSHRQRGLIGWGVAEVEQFCWVGKLTYSCMMSARQYRYLAKGGLELSASDEFEVIWGVESEPCDFLGAPVNSFGVVALPSAWGTLCEVEGSLASSRYMGPERPGLESHQSTVDSLVRLTRSLKIVEKERRDE